MPYREHNRWRAVVTVGGKRHTALHDRKKDAQEWERAKKKELKQTASEPPDSGLKKLWSGYLDYAERFAAKTVDEKTFLAGRMLKAMGPETPIDKITPEMILKFLTARAREQSAYAANKDLKNLRAFYAYLRRFKNIDLDPTKHIQRWAHHPADKQPPSQADILKVLAVATREERVFLLAYLHTGARRSEIFRLTWDDVNFEQRGIRLTTIKTADGSPKSAWVPMTDELHTELSWWYRSRPVKGHYVFVSTGKRFQGQPFRENRRFLPRLCQRAGVKTFGYHALRHFYASMLADSGKASIPTIQRLLRHGSPRTTEIYLHGLQLDLHGVVNDALQEKIHIVHTRDEKKGVNQNG